MRLLLLRQVKPQHIRRIVWLALLTLLASCTGFPYGDDIKDNARILHENHPNITRYIAEGNRTLSYLYQPNKNSQTLVVFVHGSPGQAEGYAYFMRHPALLSRFSLIAVDRLGYERKNNQGPERSLQKQSEAVHRIIMAHQQSYPQSYPQNYSMHKRVILVGHSFGGPVIARMALDYPQHYSHLVMVAASVDPALEKTKWFQIPANWKALRWLVPNALDTSNQEILALKKELILVQNTLIKNTEGSHVSPHTPPHISPHSSPLRMHIIHGTNDKLVPVENVDYMHKMYPQSVEQTVILKGANHFLPWSHPEEIMDAIYALDNDEA